MDILVKHGTTNITQYVISYVREHNICSGIGTLELVLSSTYSTAINPHDTFSIYENGDFKVKYYVSDVSENAPEGTIRLQCQDRSKYLVDYFIADQYTIDYPSYTRYWIETFFDQAGIPYSFTTDSQGNLLSNYTVLGLQPAYDQIVMLCQMSGWYFYFDGNGTAIIGSLTTDVSSGGSIDKTDILSIKKTIDDKMLRNRAVVWGGYDPLRHQNAYANVVTHTPYNYDNNDIRTMVISNNNIPNLASAYDIANMLIKEFAKPTIVKEISVWGARNFNLGEFLRVTSDVYKGRGLITSFSVNMDRSGLTTTVLLDERCPRLFGFFNFGDYVYVGTFGDGVWRKHIRFDPAWYNFSTGLTNLNISDLHINNGVFGAVDDQGEMYYALYDEPWFKIEISGMSLESSSENHVDGGTGGGIEGGVATFSGLRARATIIDKLANTAKYAIDNYSGMNTGDYFLYTSMFATISGVVTSSGVATMSGVVSSGVVNSGSRAWIMEYDVLNGDTVGTPYPIVYSGEYAFVVLDLENDGKNDYVSVVTSGGVIQGTRANFGSRTSKFNSTTIVSDDENSSVRIDGTSAFDLEGQTLYKNLGNASSISLPTFSVFDNEYEGESEIVSLISSGGSRISVTKFTSAYDSSIGRNRVTSSTQTSSGTLSVTTMGAIKITKLTSTDYRIWGITTNGNQTDPLEMKVVYIDWNTTTNVLSSQTTVIDYTHSLDPDRNNATFYVDYGTIALEDKIYGVAVISHGSYTGASAHPETFTNYVEIHTCVVDTNTLAASAGVSYRIDFNTSEGNGVGLQDWRINKSNPSTQLLSKTGKNSVEVAFSISEADQPPADPPVGTSFDNWLIYSHDGFDFNITNIQHTDSNTDSTFLYYARTFNGMQVTGEKFFIILGRSSTNGLTYLYDGSTVQIETLTTIPYYLNPINIYTITGINDYFYIAKDGSDWYTINASNFTPISLVSFDPRYTINYPFSTTNFSSYPLFWSAYDSNTGKNVILKTGTSSVVSPDIVPYSPISFGGIYGIVCGNFFVDFGLATTPIKVLYVDNVPAIPMGFRFLLLQRDNEDFHLIKESLYPMRADISLNSPLLTVGSGSDSFISDFIYDNEITETFPAPGNNLEVRDYRYTLLETTSGNIVSSGAGVQTQILFATKSGIYTGDADTYSGGFILLDIQPLVTNPMERIETTNYTYPGEFIFVTTSGENPEFWQKDNDKLVFTSYSGLPPSRVTIIRCDDFV